MTIIEGEAYDYQDVVVHERRERRDNARERRDLMRRRANRPKYVEPVTFQRRESLVTDLESWGNTRYPYDGNRAMRRTATAKAMRDIRKAVRRAT